MVENNFVFLYKKIEEKVLYYFIILIITVRKYTQIIRIFGKTSKMVIDQYFFSPFKLSAHIWAENMR